MAFGQTPTTTTEGVLATNQVFISSVAVPNTASGDLIALEGGPASTDSNSNKTAPASIYVKDGSDLAEGATTDAAVTGDNAGSLSAKLRGLSKIFADVWDSVNHHIKVDGSGVTQPVSGTVTANAGTNLNTSTLALESGGNIASMKADLDLIIPGIQGWIAATGTGTATTDDTLTFAQQVRKVYLHNASTVNVPFEFDGTSAATSDFIEPGQRLIFDDIRCTTVHVFPSATLPINTTNGLYVKGWK